MRGLGDNSREVVMSQNDPIPELLVWRSLTPQTELELINIKV